MAKLIPHTDSDCSTSYNAVFINTSLRTHLAFTVSSSDTVSDIKKKILHEHKLCFPDMGDINIHALKVKRRGVFYHLSESMLVKTAFYWIKRGWFIYVDASIDDKRHLPHPDLVDGVNPLPDHSTKRLSNAVDLLLLQDESNVGVNQNAPVADGLGLDIVAHKVSDGSKSTSLGKGSDFLVQEKNDHQESRVENSQFEGGEGSSRNKVGSCDKNMRKRKRKGRSSLQGLASKESEALLDEPRKDELQREIPDPESSLGNEAAALSHDKQTGNHNISDLGKGSHTKVQRTNVVSWRNEVSGEIMECGNDKHKNNVDVNYDDLLEDTPQCQPAAKKRQKIEKEKGDEDLLKENRNLISDFNKEVARPTISHYSLGDMQKKTNATLEVLSTERMEGLHLQSTNPSNKKWKKKKKSANLLNQEIAAVPSFGMDIGGETSGVTVGNNPKDLVEESDPAFVQKHHDPVQEASQKPSSQDIEMGDINTDNVERRQDNLKLPTISGSKRIRSSKKVILDNYQKAGTLLQDTYPKTMPLENGNPFAEDEMELQIKEQVVTSKLHETSGTLVASDAEHVKGSITNVSSSEPHKAVNEDYSNDKSNREEMPPEKQKEGSEMDTVSSFLLATDKEIDDVIQNLVESARQTQKTEFNTENMDGKSRKKTKKKRSSDAKKVLEIQAENDDACQNGSAPSIDNMREVDSSSKMMRQSSLAKRSFINGSKLEHEKDVMVETDPPSTQLNFVTVESSQVAQHKSEGNSETRCLEAIVNDSRSKSGCANKTSNDMEVSCEDDRINFNDYFVSSQHCDETVASSELLIDKETKAKGIGNVMKSEKNKKKLNRHSDSAKTRAGNSSTTEPQQSFSNDMCEKLTHHAGHKPSKISKSGVKATPSCKSEKLKLNGEDIRRSNTVKPSGSNTHENNRGKARGTKSIKILQNKSGDGNESRGRHNRMDGRKSSATNIGPVVNGFGRKSSATNIGPVVNGLLHEKSVIGKSVTIFDDDSSGDSADEDGVDNSDAGARTPSDNSMSSNSSDDESSADLNSSQNGSYSLKIKQGGQKNTKPRSSSGLTLDTILRSSSSYKKAKLIASQSQLEDTESQPVEFVPDSEGKP